jgi:hypothetical protein
MAWIAKWSTTTNLYWVTVPYSPFTAARNKEIEAINAALKNLAAKTLGYMSLTCTRRSWVMTRSESTPAAQTQTAGSSLTTSITQLRRKREYANLAAALSS